MSDNSFAGINFDDPLSRSIFEEHKKTMCPQWETENQYLPKFNIVLMKNNKNGFIVNGQLRDGLLALSLTEKLFIRYWAANAPTYNQSFSGSGLPYPNEWVAFQDSPNVGITEVIQGKFSFTLNYPNSYYLNMGTVLVHPEVKIQVCNSKNEVVSDIQTISLGNGIPFRTLTWPEQRNWNNGPMFYCNNNLPARNQYQILLDSAYPKVNEIPKNFWGSMPPH